MAPPIPPPALTEDEEGELDEIALDNVTGGRGVAPPPALTGTEKGGTVTPRSPAPVGGFEPASK